MLLKLFIFKKKYFAAPLKEIKTFFVKKMWIRSFGIRQNMSQAS